MPELNEPPSMDNGRILFRSHSPEAQRILTDLQNLRHKIIDAWEERGVILTGQEQKALKAEIVHTCSLLTDLTSSAE